MARTASFGELFRQLRAKKGESLRTFCQLHGFDPGNISRLERGILPPPQSKEKLMQYASALDLHEGSEEWLDFFDLAYVAAGHIPPAVMTDQEVLARLPLLFRTLGNGQLDADRLDELIELIRKA